MWIIFIVFSVAIAMLAFMWKQAFENNVLFHQVFTQGTAESIKLYFISDTHNRVIQQRTFKQIDATVDFIVIGGDFVDQRTSYAKLEGNLKQLAKIAPIYFVWGNNDREIDETYLRQVFQRYNVTILANTAVQIPHLKNPLWLSAINDTTQHYDIEKAIAACKENEPLIFVSHNPQIFPEVKPFAKPILQMGGHLHGGQIRFGKYGVHPPGSFEIREGVPTLISNGYGTTLVPFRLGAKPQSHVVEIHFQPVD